MNTAASLTLIGSVLVVLLLTGSSLVVKPGRMELTKLDGRVEGLSEQLKNSISRLADIRGRSGEVKAVLTGVEGQVCTRMDLLPTLDRIPDMVKSIIDSGSGLGLEFVSVMPVHDNMFSQRLEVCSINGRALYELPVQVRVRGRYRQLAQYLEALGGLQYSGRIDEVELTRHELAKSPGLLEMTVQLKILYL